MKKVIEVETKRMPKAGLEETLGHLLILLTDHGKATPEEMCLLQELLYRSVLQKVAA